MMGTGIETGLNANREYKDSVFTLLLNNEKALAEVYGVSLGRIMVLTPK
jgi:hypothetical protein